MPLPWTAPGFGQGIYTSQAPFYIPEKIDPRLLALIARDREKSEEGLQQAVAAVSQALGQQRNDQIANQIMNQYQVPRAAAVDPSAYDPTLAKEQGLDYQGPGLAPPATAPFRGGATGLAAAMKARELERQDVSDEIKQQYMLAQIGHLGRLPGVGRSGGYGAPSGAPVVDPATGLIWNGRNWVKPPAGGGGAPKAFKPVGVAVARGKLDETGEFTNDYTGAEEGPMVKVKLPTGKESVMYWTDFQKLQQGATPQTTAPRGETGGARGIPKVSSPEEARKLPSGTRFYDANGVLRVVP